MVGEVHSDCVQQLVSWTLGTNFSVSSQASDCTYCGCQTISKDGNGQAESIQQMH